MNRWSPSTTDGPIQQTARCESASSGSSRIDTVSNICSTETMTEDPRRAETLYFNGYAKGQTVCLTKGADAARLWLRERPRGGDPLRSGFARALWDWEDANGVPHDPLEGVS